MQEQQTLQFVAHAKTLVDSPSTRTTIVFHFYVFPVDQVPSVFIHKVDGDALALLVDSGADVRVNITEGIVLTTLRIYEDGSVSVVPGPGAALDQRNVTPVKNLQLLVVCLSFVALLTVGLVCLLVYAVKRNKYLQAKNRARNPVSLFRFSPHFSFDYSYISEYARTRHNGGGTIAGGEEHVGCRSSWRFFGTSLTHMKDTYQTPSPRTAWVLSSFWRSLALSDTHVWLCSMRGILYQRAKFVLPCNTGEKI